MKFTQQQYNQAIASLGLSMIQEVALVPQPWPANYFELSWRALGRGDNGNVQTMLGFQKVLENSEGQAPFNILQPSLEDAQGVSKMQQLKKVAGTPPTWIGLFSLNTVIAILMVDFWNPVYSWRRGVLMQYVPRNANYDSTTKSYDLEFNFIQNVRNSSYVQAAVEDSPEYQFIQLLSVNLQTNQGNIQAYFNSIQQRIQMQPVQALQDYMALAESRRRIYRPLPLDEFGYSMPYALNIAPDAPLVEMTATGTIQPIASRGVNFFTAWTTSLANSDPQIIPSPSNSGISGPVTAQSLPKPARLALRCQSIAMSSKVNQHKPSSCPYFARSKPQIRAVISTADQAKASRSAAIHNSQLPTWTDNVLPMMQSPYWVPESSRSATGLGWIDAMKHWGPLKLDSYDDVKASCVTIYEHLRSKSMPVTRDPGQYWPEDALETLRSWANGGFLKDKSDTPNPQMIIPSPVRPMPDYRVRKDIMDLSKEELAVYQSKLDEVLRVGDLGSKWQELGLLR